MKAETIFQLLATLVIVSLLVTIIYITPSDAQHLHRIADLYQQLHQKEELLKRQRQLNIELWQALLQ